MLGKVREGSRGLGSCHVVKLEKGNVVYVRCRSRYVTDVGTRLPTNHMITTIFAQNTHIARQTACDYQRSPLAVHPPYVARHWHPLVA